MKFIFNRRALVVVLLIAFSTLAIGSFAKSKYEERQTVLHDLETFAKVIEKIKSFYVDDIDTHELVTQAIEDMLKELDPHSQYLSGLDYEDLMLSTQGQFGGLGIFITFRDNYPTVISPIEGTPAFKAGIQGGDQIIEIEGESCDGWQTQRAVRYLRGEPGSPVRFKVSRPGLDEAIEYSLVREEIKVKSVPYAGNVEDYGYVKVSNFSKSTREELQDALEDLESQNVKGLVIDLRSNPGGLLQAATGVAELFLEKDKLVVYTKGRYAKNNHKYYASKSRKFGGIPVVVMINGASASASEIVAGALQDWDAGFVVGQTSFGKGTVQTVFSLSDSQAVKLTTAKYYTPSGRSIHRDRRHDEEEPVTAEVSEDEDGEMQMTEVADDPELAEKPVFHTSSGRVVYGGGGITPDLEFEPQTYEELERRLERDGLFFSFAIDYSIDHEMKDSFKVDDEVVKEFKDLLEEKEFEYEDEEFKASEDYIRKAITREIYNRNFGRQAMYRKMLDYDVEFQRVLSIMRDNPELPQMFKYADKQKDLNKASLD